MRDALLTPADVDRMLRYPRGRALRLARRGAIPHVRLPDGEIRFDHGAVMVWLASLAQRPELVAVTA